MFFFISLPKESILAQQLVLFNFCPKDIFDLLKLPHLVLQLLHLGLLLLWPHPLHLQRFLRLLLWWFQFLGFHLHHVYMLCVSLLSLLQKRTGNTPINENSMSPKDRKKQTWTFTWLWDFFTTLAWFSPVFDFQKQGSCGEFLWFLGDLFNKVLLEPALALVRQVGWKWSSSYHSYASIGFIRIRVHQGLGGLCINHGLL